MSDIIEALSDAVSDACDRHPSWSGPGDSEPAFNTSLWSALDQIGIALLSVPEELGGSGGDVLTATAVLQVLGRYSAAVPLVETALLAGWLLSESGVSVAPGPMAAAVGGSGFSMVEEQDGWMLDGELTRVPWVRHADHLVVLAGRHVLTCRRGEFELREGTNLAGEPRDDVVFDHRAVPPDRVHILSADSVVDPHSFAARGAVGRLALMAGAARRSLEMAIGYASERQQFGRSLDKFQSVQQQIAAMAAEVLLCKVAAESAAKALDESSPSWELPIAAAKVSAGQAAGTVARIAHQIHGAIGFTEEHDLRRSTTRLWSWRDEFGGVGEWAATLGELAASVGAQGLWPLLTDGKASQPADNTTANHTGNTATTQGAAL